jgi:hypothetical protein
MRKFLFFVLIPVVVLMIFTACRKLDVAPAPEVEIIDFTPLGTYVTPPDTTVDTTVVIDTTVTPHDTTLVLDTLVTYVYASIDSIYFKVWNYVDARITEMDYQFHSTKNDTPITKMYTTDLNVYLSGGNEECGESNVTILYGLILESDEVLDYMYSENDNTVAEIIFRGVDNYTEENTFSCRMNFALLKIGQASAFPKRKLLHPIDKGGNNE